MPILSHLQPRTQALQSCRSELCHLVSQGTLMSWIKGRHSQQLCAHVGSLGKGSPACSSPSLSALLLRGSSLAMKCSHTTFSSGCDPAHQPWDLVNCPAQPQTGKTRSSSPGDPQEQHLGQGQQEDFCPCQTHPQVSS